MITPTLLSLLLPALVSAHGYVNKVTIDGTVYQGNSVGTTPTISSVIRQVNTNSPVKGATNPDINCGAGAQLAADVANANPGSTVQVYWVGGTTGTSAVSSLSFMTCESVYSFISSGPIIRVRSCITWPSARDPAQLTTQVVPSGSRFQSKVSNPVATLGTKQNFVRSLPLLLNQHSPMF